MKKILFMMLGVLIALPAFARDFTYEYGGQTLTYTVLDENAKTCKTKDGSYQSGSYRPGNKVSGNLVLPANPKDGEVEYTLTTIGTYAFSLCSGLTSVNIPNSVTSIGEYAFHNCSGLTSVNIPNSVTSIGDRTFSLCSGLTSVNIPESVTSIGRYAFSSCSGLTSVNIPNSVTSIDYAAFYYCSGLKTLIIEDGDTELNVGAIAFKYAPIENLTIGRNWTYGGSGAMSTGIKNLTLTNGVTVIPEYAFHNCSGLTSVNIPESVSSIGSQAFVGCSALTSVTSFNQNPPVMKDNSFAGRYALATLNLSPEALSRYLATNWSLFENIGSMSGNVFGTYETGNLKYRLIPALTADENNLAIVIPGDYASLTEVTIPERFTVSENGSTTRYYVDAIGYKAFNSASNLTTVTFNSRNASKTIGEYAFAGTKISAISIPQSVETIHDYAFSNCSALENIEIGNSVKTIGNYAFTKCGKLSTVSIPGNVETIGSYAFSNCSALENIEIGSGVKTIGNYAFSDCTALKDVEIGSETIGDFAFSDCTALKDVKIGSGVKTIGDFAFNNCSAIVSIAIPSPVETIGNGAFNSCTSLSDITVTESVKKIGDKAFFETKATKVALSEGLEYIGALAFSADVDREADPIYIPTTLQSVGKDAFLNYNCHHVNISDLAAWCNIDFENVSANPSAYSGVLYLNDEKIENLIIPSTVEIINQYTFSKNNGIKTVTLSEGVRSIGQSAFSDCTNLESVTFNRDLLTIEDKAFWNSGIKEVSIPNSVESFEKGTFGNCSNLLMLSIGNNITSVDASYFEGCNNLSSLTIDDGPNPIELSGDWKNFTNLENLTINRNFTITK